MRSFSGLRKVALVGALAVAFPLISAGTAIPARVAHAAGTQNTREISSAGTTAFSAGPVGTETNQFPEIRGQNSDNSAAPYAGVIVTRSHTKGHGYGAAVKSGGQKAKSNPVLNLSFDGLNHVNQRLANGGKQFSVEPPDQGLCAGNGFVVESVNDVLRVYDTHGSALMGVADLNTFYGYAPAIVRGAHPAFGPFVTDPSCYFDAATQRWFNVVLTLDTNPKNGRFLGTNHIDMAVSKTADPTGAWTIYRVAAQNDGTQGTPNHGCSYGPCFADYPHIGADANGFYVTTNEYSFFGPEFHGAQIYAFSKRVLASNAATINVTEIDTHSADNGFPGFTIWPATSPADQAASAAGGTEYFMSSNAAAEAHDPGDGTSIGQASQQLLVWNLTNTSSLDSANPQVSLDHSVVDVGTYAAPPKADQKSGNFPLGQCLNDTSCATFLNGEPNAFGPETQSTLDSNDTRMQQVTFANGKLWGALDTALTVDGVNKAGIEYFIVKPQGDGKAKLDLQGYLGLANNNLMYPAIGVTSSGRGVMAFTVAGADYFPSAGYAGLDAKVGAGEVQIAANGAGPQDGFSGYKYYGNPQGTTRPRWGDYGATAVDGNTVWMASEYIGQTCTLAQYESGTFGACRDASGNRTRTPLANWDTRISSVTP